MAEIKFVCFDLRGKAEFCRLVLVAAGQQFEDVRIVYFGGKEWTPERKAEAPFGQLPYIVYKGKKYAQTIAIGNFFAREFGLYGKTNLDGLRIDEVVQLGEDLRIPHIQGNGAKNKGRDVSEVVRILLAENGGSGFFVGSSVTLADFAVYDVLDTVFGIAPEAVAAAFPNLKKLRSNVEAVPAINTYLASRPKSLV